MGMGYGANYADVMEEENIKKLCRAEWDCFMEAIEADEDLAGVEDVAHMIYFDSMDDDDPIGKALEQLKESFHIATDGLELHLGFHDHDECGDRYDEINGYFWGIDGMYELTEAGKKFEDKVSRKHFVTFG